MCGDRAPLDLPAAAGYSGGHVRGALVTHGPASPVLMLVGDSVYLIQSKSVGEAVLMQIP